MYSLSLVPVTNPVLKTPCEAFDFNNPQVEPLEFAQALIGKVHEFNALGLAANQVGYNFRAFAMRGYPENFVCFNPKVVSESEEQIVLEESCLSWPGLIIKIKRPRTIRVRFSSPTGDVQTKRFEGISARCFLHELDHLDGKLFFNRANLYHREQAMKRWANFKY
jgi:peptide deformylase